jgi:hypothetical protein
MMEVRSIEKKTHTDKKGCLHNLIQVNEMRY